MNYQEISELAANIYDGQQTTVYEYNTVEGYVDDLMSLAWELGWITEDMHSDDQATLRHEFDRMAHGDLDNAKGLAVYVKGEHAQTVVLSGVPNSERLTPKMARRALRNLHRRGRGLVGLAAQGRQGIRLRPGLRGPRPLRDLRRDEAGRETRHQPSCRRPAPARRRLFRRSPR